MASSSTTEQARATSTGETRRHIVKDFLAKANNLLRVSQEKKARASPLLASIIVCVLFLQIALNLFGTGLIGAVDIYTYRRAAARNILLVTQDALRREKFLEATYLNLIELELPYRPFESHDRCLTHGIKYVEVYFSGVSFTENPAIRNGTIKWVEDACAKQAFKVQPYFEPPKHPKLQYLHKLARDLKQKITAHAATTWIWVNKWYNRSTSKLPVKKVMRRAPKEVENNFVLPPNFQLVHCDVTPCRLAYMPSSPDSSTYQEAVFGRELEALEALYAHYSLRLSSFHKALRYTQLVTIVLCQTFVFLSLAMPFFGFPFEHQDNEQAGFWGYLGTEVRQLVVFGTLQVGAIAVNLAIVRRMVDPPESFTVACLVSGLAGFLAFTVPLRNPNIFTLVKSVYHLGRLVREKPAKDNILPVTVQLDAAHTVEMSPPARDWQIIDTQTTAIGSSKQSSAVSSSSSDSSSGSTSGSTSGSASGSASDSKSRTQPRRLSDNSFQEDLSMAVNEHRAAKAGSSRSSSGVSSTAAFDGGLLTPPEIMEDLQDVDLSSDASSIGSEWDVVGENGS